VRYLVLSDLHANLQAVDAVLADAATVGYDQVLVLGDLVGYGADPEAVIDRTLALDPVGLIRGNHDKVCAGLEPTMLFSDVARAAAEWTIATLPRARREQLARLPSGPWPVTDVLEICHGTPFDEDYYLVDEGDAERAFDATAANICLFGHTHIPAVFLTAAPVRDAPGGLGEDEVALPRAARALINVGSVGQPRDGDPRAAYGVLDMDRRVLRLRRVAYDIAEAQRRILHAGLPRALAARLALGQ
jgi:predicted phosphodiesterase